MFDSSRDHILAAIARQVREVAGRRRTLIVAENEPQDAILARSPERGGYGLDAIWNDDFHHSAMVALTGKNPAYYSDYSGTPQELVSAVKWGTLYQGQWYSWQKKRRGTPALDLEPAQFVTYIQNHDQIANSGKGERCHLLTSPGRYKAMTALLLLAPQTPMLFQGQEFASSSPFLFFADHQGELRAKVAQGRREFLSQFPNLALPDGQSVPGGPGGSGRRSNAAGSIGANVNGIAKSTRCTETSSGCAAKIPYSALPGGVGSMAPSFPRPRLLYDSSRTTARIVSLS